MNGYHFDQFDLHYDMLNSKVQHLAHFYMHSLCANVGAPAFCQVSHGSFFLVSYLGKSVIGNQHMIINDWSHETNGIIPINMINEIPPQKKQLDNCIDDYLLVKSEKCYCSEHVNIGIVSPNNKWITVCVLTFVGVLLPKPVA